jgi:NAD(P)-dependent dehydrogenase (short-subunit alcohol dehydrogenase family)
MSETHAVIRPARTCSPANGTTAVRRPHTCALIDSWSEHDQYAGAPSARAHGTLERIFQETGRIDGLVNLAGGFQWDKVEGSTLESWDSMFRVNLLTAVVSCEAVLPYLLRGESGTIVNIGSTGAIKATCGMGAYAASKAGVVKLTEALADELKDRGITVNAVFPSVLDTRASERICPAPISLGG